MANFFTLRRLRRDPSGTAAIEFGLAIPFLLILLTGVTELGFAIYQSMQVQNAAEAGALYASQNDWDATAVANAVVNATDTTGIVATPAPTQFCGCPSASGVATWTCGSKCASGATAGQYARVSAQIAHQTILPYPGLSLPAKLSAQSIVRLN